MLSGAPDKRGPASEALSSALADCTDILSVLKHSLLLLGGLSCELGRARTGQCA